jgi:transposase
LEQQLAQTQLKADFFEAVVDVLKRDYGVSIVKNPPGTSSKRKP